MRAIWIMVLALFVGGCVDFEPAEETEPGVSAEALFDDGSVCEHREVRDCFCARECPGFSGLCWSAGEKLCVNGQWFDCDCGWCEKGELRPCECEGTRRAGLQTCVAIDSWNECDCAYHDHKSSRRVPMPSPIPLAF